MKMVRDTTGRFALRPHYDPNELDRECEQVVTAFLKGKYGSSTFPISTDDVTALIEKEADDLDLYADLDRYGPGVEGVTLFIPGSKPQVKISRELSEAPNMENRLRTTLSHEYGHVHFHGYLFDAALSNLDLFSAQKPSSSGKQSEAIQICKRDTMLEAAQTDWMEWQAGHVCGAILMPASVVREFVRDQFGEELSAAGAAFSAQLTLQMVEAIARKFRVSKEASRVRLLRLKILHEAPSGNLI